MLHLVTCFWWFIWMAIHFSSRGWAIDILSLVTCFWCFISLHASSVYCQFIVRNGNCKNHWPMSNFTTSNFLSRGVLRRWLSDLLLEPSSKVHSCAWELCCGIGLGWSFDRLSSLFEINRGEGRITSIASHFPDIFYIQETKLSIDGIVSRAPRIWSWGAY